MIPEEIDATVIASKWLDSILGPGVRARMDNIVKQIDEFGFPPLRKGSNFRTALIHFGKEHELVKLELSKKAGIAKADNEIM